MPPERIYSQVLNNGIPITLRFRSVKLFRISVKPDGSVEAVAPLRMGVRAAMSLANERAGWVQAHRDAALERAARANRYITGERVFLWGSGYELRVVAGKSAACISEGTITLGVREGAGFDERRAAFLALYRRELEKAIPPLLAEYAAKLGVEAPEWSLRDMRTRWGSCTPARKTVRFALNLAAKPEICLKYVVAHELTHLKIHGHGPQFHELVRSVFPYEREAVKLLRQSPV